MKACCSHLYFCIPLSLFLHKHAITHSYINCVWVSESISGQQRPLLRWADANWNLWLTAPVLLGVLFVSVVVFAFPKAGSFLIRAAHGARPRFPANSRHCVLWSCSLRCISPHWSHILGSVFIVPQICWVLCVLHVRIRELTIDLGRSGLTIWNMWEMGDHVRSSSQILCPPSVDQTVW